MAAESDSSVDDIDEIDIWKVNRKKGNCCSSSIVELPCENEKLPSQNIGDYVQRLENLKNKSKIIREGSRLCRERTEKRRSEKLVKKALKDPLIKKLVEDKDTDPTSDTVEETSKEKWQDIKAFLTVNDHVQGPVSHGDFGPKTELENLVDGAIEEGDFTKAEILSDTLADRQFAVKIAHAFKAKRYAEKIAAEEEEKKAKRLKKLPWGFEVKERWQMKGNM